VGGLVGYDNEASVIKNIIIEGDINTSGGWRTGGVVGYAYKSTLNFLSYYGDVTSNSSTVGGVVGYANACVDLGSLNALNGTITGSSYVGGIVGELSAASGRNLSKCLMKSDVNGTTKVGGLIGELLGNVNSFNVEYNVVIGTVNASVSKVGGLAGEASSDFDYEGRYNIVVSDIQGTTVDDDPILGDDYSGYPWSNSLNYYDSDVETLSSSHGTGRTTAQIKDAATYSSWGINYSNSFSIISGQNGGYPFPKSFNNDLTPPTITIASAQSSPTATSPIVFNLTASENISGLALTDFSYTGCVSQSLTGSGSSYTLTVSPTSSNVVVGVSLASNTFQDNRGNVNTTTASSSIKYYPPTTVNLSSSDSDNIVNVTQLVTITAAFSRDMQATPTLSITGVVTNTAMSLQTSSTTWYYEWDTSGVATGTYSVTVAGTDTFGYAYSETTSLTIEVERKIWLDTNGVTIKCPTANVSETAIVNGKSYIVVDEAALRTRENNGDDMTCVCTSRVYNMSELFKDNLTFNQDIGSWDTSNVTTTFEMFKSPGVTYAFNQDISNWDLSNVTNMESMFNGALNFNQDIGGWDVSNVTNLKSVFKFATNFDQDLGGWDVSSATTLEEIFNAANAFTNGGTNTINYWDTSNVTNLGYTFAGASSFNQDIGSWDTTNVTSFEQTFAGATVFNQNIGVWDTSSLDECYSMFEGATAFNNGGSDSIKDWDVSRVTIFSYMFDSASAFNQDIGDWDVSSVTAGNMDNMFSSATVFNQDLSQWCVTTITSTPTDFSSSSALTAANHPVWGAGNCGARVTLTTSDSDNLITTGLVTITATFDRNMQATPTISIAGVVTNTAMSLNTSSTVWEYRWEVPSSITTGSFSVTVGGTDTTNIVYSGTESITLQIDPDFYLDSNGVTIKCPGVANGATGYVDGKLFTSIGSRNTLRNKISANEDVSCICTTQQTNFVDIWNSTSNNSDASSWDTSNVTTFYFAFDNAWRFNSDISKWDVSNVTNMAWAFHDASDFNQDIGDWDVSNVTNMQEMFHYAQSFNQDIGEWDVSNVTNMGGMFGDADAFNQDLTQWCVSGISSEPSGFAESTFQVANRPNWGICPSAASLTISTTDLVNSDTVITSGIVTLTATFDLNMQATPTIAIPGLVTNTAMSLNTSATIWEYVWYVPSSVTTGTYTVSVSATDTLNRPYTRNETIDISIAPTFYYDANGVTIKCSGCSAGDRGYLDGNLYTAYDNATLGVKSISDLDWNRVVTTLVTSLNGLFDGEASFNQDISSWDTSRVTNMTETIKSSTKFYQDIVYWEL
ncbi:MAG: BspA family leucine-rich repeat surface protein, partial [Flavobacteriaceae bacterium]